MASLLPMAVEWTRQAEHDRTDIFLYVLQDSPQAAISIDELLGNAAGRLADFPYLGREGRVPGTRELIPHRSYRIVYEIVGDRVLILSVIHTSRQWPTVE